MIFHHKISDLKAIKKWSKYSIFRIISEDRPPRDEPGSRMKVLKFLLENETDFKNTTKAWIVNSFIDLSARQEFIDLLIKHNMYFIVIPWNRPRYLKSSGRHAKITAAIGINRARNLAIKHGHLISEFTAVLDGDCFFTDNQWTDITDKIEEDQLSVARRHYSIPCSRSTIEHALSSDKAMLLAEPMPVFRHDSKIWFDNNIPFGQSDKLDFLFRLNHSKEIGHHHEMIDESLCKCLGLVHHISGSKYETEENMTLRLSLREKSLDTLLNKLDHLVFPPKLPNDYWKKIQGYFDFQGLYSHFAFNHSSGSKFVEIGSWLGASTCYLATEILNRKKDITLYAVDTWEGSDEPDHIKKIKSMGGPDALFDKFKNHMEASGVSNVVKPLRMTSIEASKRFEDNSLDVVFIDASHRYGDVLNDIKHWYPKVKSNGGKIAGHDYVAGNTVSEHGVVKAVHKFFQGKNLEISTGGRTWLHHK